MASQERRQRKQIYLDYAATTPVDPEVLQAMLPYLKEAYGNPSSVHALGQRARVAIDEARDELASFLNCQPEEIVFTGSATEANNLALKGPLQCLELRTPNIGLDRGRHVVTTKIEHEAVLGPCQQLEKQGVSVTYLPVDKEGLVKVEQVERAIKPNTVLVSVMYANNEIGTIQPIAEIGKLVEEVNKERSSQLSHNLQPTTYNLFFHTDAVQGVNYLNCDVQKLGVDLLTLSSHKIYGPKGVGALFVRKGTPLTPQVSGGGQELGRRSGTENVAGIVGLGEAVKKIKKDPPGSRRQQKSKIKKINDLRDKLVEEMLKRIPNAHLNGSRESRLPNNVNVRFEGVEGETLVIALDQEGVAVSTGSACAARSEEASHVLLALGLSKAQAKSSVRLTLGRYTTEKEIDQVLQVLPRVVKKLRAA